MNMNEHIHALRKLKLYCVAQETTEKQNSVTTKPKSEPFVRVVWSLCFFLFEVLFLGNSFTEEKETINLEMGINVYCICSFNNFSASSPFPHTQITANSVRLSLTTEIGAVIAKIT